MGETAIGKSSLMKPLFSTTFETKQASHHLGCVCLWPQTYNIQESSVHLRLTIMDTMGFRDQINKDDRPIVHSTSSCPHWAFPDVLVSGHHKEAGQVNIIPIILQE